MDCSIVDTEADIKNVKLDVMKFVGRSSVCDPCPELVYFDIKKYTCHDGFDGVGFAGLTRDLSLAALEEGFYLIKNGHQSRRNQACQEFVCNWYPTYKGGVQKKKDTVNCVKSTVYPRFTVALCSVMIRD